MSRQRVPEPCRLSSSSSGRGHASGALPMSVAYLSADGPAGCLRRSWRDGTGGPAIPGHRCRAGVAAWHRGMGHGGAAELGFVATVGRRRRLIHGERLLGSGRRRTRERCDRVLLGRFHGDAAALQDHVAGGQDVLAAETGCRRGSTKQCGPRPRRSGRPWTRAAARRRLRLRADPERQRRVRRRFWTFQGEKPGLVPELLDLRGPVGSRRRTLSGDRGAAARRHCRLTWGMALTNLRDPGV